MKLQSVLGDKNMMVQLQNAIDDSITINLVAGSLLKKRRILLGLSQKTLGQIVGMSKQEIVQYEQDKLVILTQRKFPLLQSIASLFVM